jgi:hypothetical protein
MTFPVSFCHSGTIPVLLTMLLWFSTYYGDETAAYGL